MSARATTSDTTRDLLRAFDALEQAAREVQARPKVSEAGVVASVGGGIATVRGLPGIAVDETVVFEGGELGVATDLWSDGVGVVLLDRDAGIEAGALVTRTHRAIEVPVGDALVGRVVNPLGAPLDQRGEIRADRYLPIERPAPAIVDRAPVTEPLHTGIKVIDALIPIGRGQRELLVGDRQTGKSSVALSAVLAQRDSGVRCVYCLIGQRGAASARLVATLEREDAMAYTTVVVASSSEPPGLRQAAPFAAMSIGEAFMERGHDVLVVLDDLTQHARAYRELSLLLRRPPGREAYPGDVFYLHARLLERATHLSERRGGGSLTALPVIETQAQNMAAYIPTNLISITDGQIVLSPQLAARGVLPAVDVGLSVSRVGGKAQLAAYRAVAGRLRLAYAQYEELERFARFGADLDDDTRHALIRGERVREVLKQDALASIPVCEQVAVLLAASSGLLDEVPLAEVADVERAIRHAVHRELTDACDRVVAGAELSDRDREQFFAHARHEVDAHLGGEA
ncbi:MAG: F0F1 ATP synthase subunit alpha [Trueperaceae bacterium]